MERSAANFKAYVSFHSYGQYVLYPWGYDRVVPPDYKDLENVGQAISKVNLMKQWEKSIPYTKNINYYTLIEGQIQLIAN